MKWGPYANTAFMVCSANTGITLVYIHYASFKPNRSKNLRILPRTVQFSQRY